MRVHSRFLNKLSQLRIFSGDAIENAKSTSGFSASATLPGACVSSGCFHEYCRPYRGLHVFRDDYQGLAPLATIFCPSGARQPDWRGLKSVKRFRRLILAL
jgi:hypothetical protein